MRLAGEARRAVGEATVPSAALAIVDIVVRRDHQELECVAVLMLGVHERVPPRLCGTRRVVISSGAVEGLNNKLKVIAPRSYGFRSYDITTTALYHGMGNFPEPAFPHRFC